MNNKLVLVTGGARSGKSSFGEMLAEQSGRPISYIATAQIFDEEMKERVRLHRERRAAHWLTCEAPFDAADVLRRHDHQVPVVLLDCLTLFVTNHLLRAIPEDADSQVNTYKEYIPSVVQAVHELVDAVKSVPATVIVVTNEVGLGIVPDNALSRMFRDLAGQANQEMASVADEVYLVVSGIPVRIK